MSIGLIGKIGSKDDPQATELASKTRNWISNQRRHPTQPALMKTFPGVIKKSCPSADLRSLSDAYNCFGLAFGSRRTHITDDIDRILKEDGFRQIPEDEVRPFDLVVYRSTPSGEPLHVGVVWKAERIFPEVLSSKKLVQVISQWGRAGEYFHNVDHVDPAQHGAHRQYWTDRVN